MAKKYEPLRKKLPAFTEEPSYQQLVDEKKQELLGTLDGEDANVNRLAAMLVHYEKQRKALYSRYASKTNDAEYEINLYRKALSQVIKEIFLNDDIKEVRLSSGELVKLDDKPILSIKDKPVAIEWALANVPEMLTVSYSGLNRTQIEKLAEWGAKKKMNIEVTLSDRTLETLAAENALQGKPDPPGLKLTCLTQAKVYGLNRSNGENEE